jgi:hypothetical protein
MGYTHYWNPKEPLEEKVWKTVVEHVHGLVAVAVADGIVLDGPLGESDEMVFDEDVIAFNGHGDAALESFYVERAPTVPEHRKDVPDMQFFTFCKTGRRPYDVVVTAALCLMETLTDGHFRVSSDGSRHEWEDGLALARKILKTAEIPAGVEE